MSEKHFIKNLINAGESEQLEFKASLSKEEIARTLCAFLNSIGGIVLVGVKDDGKIIGVKDSVKLEFELRNFLMNAIIPEAPITVSTEEIEGKNVLFLKVWNGSKPPYVFDGNIYYRKSSQTLKATSEVISNLIVERQQSELHWERQPAIGIELDDLDEFEIRNTLKDLSQSGRGKAFDERQIPEFLNYYGLFRNGSLTNAAVVLFAKIPTRYLPQCRVRLTVFESLKSSDTFKYDRILEGNLFQVREEMLQFFDVNIAAASKFSEKHWLRDDVPFPKSALREGLMNALIHRDYSNVAGSVFVGFYPDRLEISNYGELPSELKPSDLVKNHLSLPRNPDIAHICFLRQMIEKIGRGTIKIIEDCELKGYPRPKWHSKNGVTTLVFPKITVTAKTDDTVSDTVTVTISDTVNDTVSDTVSDTVKMRMTAIIKAIVEKPGMRSNELAKLFQKSEASLRRDLQKLSKLVEFVGAPKTGGYQMTKFMRQQLKR